MNLDPNHRSASTLAPALQDTLKWCREQGQSPGFVSVADGPGSFTGLRIGVTTAKTLCYALNLPLVAVDSLAAIAAAALHANPDFQTVWSVLNAYRGQVFTGEFERATLLPDETSTKADWTGHPDTTEILKQDAWDARLQQKPPKTGLTGDAKPMGARSVSALTRDCDAIGVGLMAVRAAALGQFSDPMQLVPAVPQTECCRRKRSKALNPNNAPHRKLYLRSLPAL